MTRNDPRPEPTVCICSWPDPDPIWECRKCRRPAWVKRTSYWQARLYQIQRLPELLLAWDARHYDYLRKPRPKNPRPQPRPKLSEEELARVARRLGFER